MNPEQLLPSVQACFNFPAFHQMVCPGSVWLSMALDLTLSLNNLPS